ncbi:hypothetical protein LCGC14_2743110, partial [marine sediment metagenome]
NDIALLWEPRPATRARVNSDIISRIVKLHQDGYGLRELSAWFRVSKGSTKTILTKAGIQFRQSGSRQGFYDWESKKAQLVVRIV